jgi:hypothetical protein
MIQRQKLLQMSRMARSAFMASTLLTGTFLTVFTIPADARGGHGFAGAECTESNSPAGIAGATTATSRLHQMNVRSS